MKNKSGQSVIEYIILVAIIAVTSLGVVKVLGQTITSKLGQITLSLQGKSHRAKQIEEPEVERKHTQKRGMEDFYESSE